MNVIAREGWLYLIPDHCMHLVPSTPRLTRLSDFVVNPEGHLVKNRSDGRVVAYKTTFTWLERFQVLFTGRLP